MLNQAYFVTGVSISCIFIFLGALILATKLLAALTHSQLNADDGKNHSPVLSTTDIEQHAVITAALHHHLKK